MNKTLIARLLKHLFNDMYFEQYFIINDLFILLF